MNFTEKQIKFRDKQVYEAPIVLAIAFSSEDMISTSGGNNMGEWDPQSFQ